MQLVGLVLGLFGALLLTIPSELYAMYYRVTRCKPVPQVVETKGEEDKSLQTIATQKTQNEGL